MVYSVALLLSSNLCCVGAECWWGHWRGGITRRGAITGNRVITTVGGISNGGQYKHFGRVGVGQY